MPDFIAPLLPEYAIQIPQSAISLLGWAAWLGVIVFITVRKRDQQFKLDRSSLAWLALLSVLLLIFTPFLGFSIPSENSSSTSHLMILAALPWLAAGGILGLVPGVVLAGLSGILLAYFDTHSIFTPLLFMTAALVFTLAIRQTRSGGLYRLLRVPPVAALAAAALLFPLTFLALFLDAEGDLAASLLSAITQFAPAYLALAGMVLLGGLGCLGVKGLAKDKWAVSTANADPVEAQQNLGLRYVLIALPLAVVLLTATVVGQWKSAQAFAKRSVVEEMTTTAQVLADALPDFVAGGEAALQQIAVGIDPAQINLESAQAVLEAQWAAGDTFDQLALAGPDGGLLASVPTPLAPSEGERFAIQQILAGASVAPVAAPDGADVGNSLSFFAPKLDGNGQLAAVLWGRVVLADVPAFKPYLTPLNGLLAAGGEVLIVDSAGQVVYDSASSSPLTAYTGSSFLTATFFETVDEAGARQMEYFQPVEGLGWSVVTSIPDRIIQLQAVQEVIPLILAGMALIALEAGIAVLMFSQVSQDADQLAAEAAKIALGDLSVIESKRRYSSGLKGLADNFEQMTTSVKSRLQAQSDLLTVSERITGQLKLKDSLQVVLVAALEHGISSARIVLLDDSQPSSKLAPDQRFGMGKDARGLAPLDEDILTVTRVRGQWLMREAQIGRNFHLTRDIPTPSLLLSLPLRWKNKLLGTLWLASDRRTDLNEEELAYFADLSQKAATAIINHRAFDESLTHQKQLEAVLAALGDAVLVADLNQVVIYANPAAARLPGLGEQDLPGATLAALLEETDFAAALELTLTGSSQAQEIHMADQKAYLLLVEPLLVDQHMIGTATIIKDVTAFKAQDAAKTEYVTTVSHELRSPLTLMQGYAKLLRLAGNLNDQQETYVSNIVTSVDEMRALVQNLLDLGRLDSGDTLQFKEVALNDVIQRVTDSMDNQIKQKNIELVISLPEEPVWVEADAAFLVQALKNLVDNAIKYSSNKGRIDIKVQKQAEAVLMTVEDFGPGIAPLDQRKIFKRFYHAESQVGERSGSGLGLAIVKSIAERHGGKVWFESKLGRGSSFFLQIPINQTKKVG